jgi:hypothetical protein
VLLFPNIQSQLRTFMTLLKSPRLLSSNSIIVTDALDRTKLLPYEYFSSWNLVQPWLEDAFKNMPGESRVRGGQYAMFSRMKNGVAHEILAHQWGSSVLPGDRVVMSMVVRPGSYSCCQRCGRVTPFASRKKSWTEW